MEEQRLRTSDIVLRVGGSTSIKVAKHGKGGIEIDYYRSREENKSTDVREICMKWIS